MEGERERREEGRRKGICREIVNERESIKKGGRSLEKERKGYKVKRRR